MQTKEYKILRWKDGNKCPEDLTGHIIVFDEPLIVYETIEKRKKAIRDGKEVTMYLDYQTDNYKKCSFMRAQGGFGSYSRCSGRMIIGDFFETIEDVINGKVWQEGNTKVFPNGFIPELFTEHAKL